MKIFKNNGNMVPKSNYNIVTIGSFDGIHLGHLKILETIVKKAKIKNGKSIIVTFWPHPREVLKKKENFKLLNTLEEKIKIFEEIKIDYLYIIDFSSNFAKTKAEDFVKNILISKLKTNYLVIGYNHHFGYKREGNIDYLKKNEKKFNFDIESISKKEIEKISVSSTRIRKYINNGKIESANALLGREFSISGKVVKGDGIGKKIKFPTANILLNKPRKIIPKKGVYAVKILLDKKIYLGMLNIGYRPTINKKIKTIEVNIFEFTRPIYGKRIIVSFFKRLRDEKRFLNLNELKKQLKTDKKKTLLILNKTL